ncbi:MAG TPA: NAD-dependent epimerase/dehydratase family protein [Myxococcales bacterium]|nr:NAD-dependent epimerase/dehydratase family protein [Myxococcales bacterium]
MLSGKRILITGGAGFIGTSLALRLYKDNEIVILDNLWRNALEGTDLQNASSVTVIQGDVRCEETVKKAVNDVDIVLHLASIAGVDTVMKNPVLTMEVSLYGTANVLKACMNQSHIERVVDFSTSEVFGRYAYNVGEGDVTTLGAVGEARWTYAVSKLATEHLAYNYHKQHKLPTVSIRPFNIYGPRQVGQGAIHHFIRKALAGEELIVHNDGSQIRSWCYVDDILDGVITALSNDNAVGHTFNIGNPRSTLTIYNLAREIIRLCDSQSQITFVPWDFADVELRIPNINKARELLNYEPKVDLEDGLLRTISWYRQDIES